MLPGPFWSFGQPTKGKNRRLLPGSTVLPPVKFWPAHERGKEEVFTWQCFFVLLPGPYWSFGQPTKGEKRKFLPGSVFLFCYLDLTGVLASPRKGKEEVFIWQCCSAAFLFYYLDFTEVLASPRQRKKGGFYFLPGCAVLLPRPYWSFAQPTARGKEEVYTWLCCSATWILLEFFSSPRQGKRRGFYLAVRFCYLDLTEVLASPRQGEKGGFTWLCCSAICLLLELWPAHGKGNKEVFTWLRCSATWTLLQFWPAYERGKEEVFTWKYCYATWTSLKFWPAHGREKKEVFTWLCCSGTWILLEFWPAQKMGKEEV